MELSWPLRNFVQSTGSYECGLVHSLQTITPPVGLDTTCRVLECYMPMISFRPSHYHRNKHTNLTPSYKVAMSDQKPTLLYYLRENPVSLSLKTSENWFTCQSTWWVSHLVYRTGSDPLGPQTCGISHLKSVTHWCKSHRPHTLMTWLPCAWTRRVTNTESQSAWNEEKYVPCPNLMLSFQPKTSHCSHNCNVTWK